MRWVKRNEDKPHRCPECHAIATYDRVHGRWSYGPRTILRCPLDCGVRWRSGVRVSKSTTRRMKKFLKELDNWHCTH